jgi:hypothetical protein
MNTRSRKNKGKRLQNKVRDLLLETFQNVLEQDDIKSTTMGESGEDIQLSPAARKLIPYAIECKNQEALSIWKSLEQAENNSSGYEPLLIFKRNRSKTYVTMDIKEFLRLLSESKDS